MRVSVCVCVGNSYKVALLFACFVVCRQCSPCKNVGRYFLSAEQHVEQQQERQQLVALLQLHVFKARTFSKLC